MDAVAIVLSSTTARSEPDIKYFLNKKIRLKMLKCASLWI